MKRQNTKDESKQNKEYLGKKSMPSKKYSKANNDVSWYTKYPSLVTSASSIIFNLPYGAVLDNKHPSNNTFAGTGNYTTAVPGGYIAWFSNALVSNGTSESPLNVALKNFQTYVRHANSGSVNYEGSDLMQYLLSVISLYPLIEDLKRDLRLILTYKATNRYVYKAVLEASGYSPAQVNSMIQNYAQYVTGINIVIAQLNSFKVPNDIALIARREWLSSHVFRDDELDKASIYMFKPIDYLHYDWANAVVHTKDFPSNQASWTTKLDVIVTEINNLLAYEDIGTMIGDILKAYGDNACHYVDPMVLDQVIDAEYSQEAGEQFRNLCCSGFIPEKIDYIQVANDSQLLQTVCTVRGTTHTGKMVYVDRDNIDYSTIKATIPITYMRYPVLMADSDSPDNAKVIVNTRLQWISEVFSYVDATTAVPHDDIVYLIHDHGTEIICKVTTFVFGHDVELSNPVLITNNGYATYGIYGPSNMIEVIDPITQLYPTRFAPQFNCIVVVGGNSVLPVNLFCGVNNIVLDRNWLRNMHQGCLMSLLSLPMFKLLESK